MAHVVADRVLESTSTTGTGALTLAGAVTGFRRFSAACSVGDTVPYFIEAIDSLGQPTGDYEYGIGTYSAANTLTRTTVLGSSNAGAPVNLTAGSKNVGLTSLAAQQSWVNVTAGRALGTTYTNTTGHAITVAVVINSVASPPSGSAGLTPTIAGVAQVGPLHFVQGANYQVKDTFVVPAGATYSVAAFGTVGGTLLSWNELR